MSAIVVIEQVVPAHILGQWVYTRQWMGRDDEREASAVLGPLGLTTEEEAWHEVERRELRVKGDEAMLEAWVGSEGMQ